MRTYLKKPWGAALAVAAAYLLVSLLLLLDDDARDDRGSELPARGPDALEIALTPLSAVPVFLAVWWVLWLLWRRPLTGTRAGREDLDTRAARPARSTTRQARHRR